MPFFVGKKSSNSSRCMCCLVENNCTHIIRNWVLCNFWQFILSWVAQLQTLCYELEKILEFHHKNVLYRQENWTTFSDQTLLWNSQCWNEISEIMFHTTVCLSVEPLIYIKMTGIFYTLKVPFTFVLPLILCISICLVCYSPYMF